MNRPAIPRPLKRKVLVEAGHRCAIPTCRQTTTELAHITPFVEVQEHTFDNLIALCPNCHTRFDKGEIDKGSMLQYKTNLSIINGRYGNFEKRILQLFSKEEEEKEVWLPGWHDIHVYYLLEDGLLEKTGKTGGISIAGVPSREQYLLTLKGRAFIQKWLAASVLD